MLQAFEDGDLDDVTEDMMLPVHVHADGRLDVFDTAEAAEPFQTFSPEDVCGAFGMKLADLLKARP